MHQCETSQVLLDGCGYFEFLNQDWASLTWRFWSAGRLEHMILP